VTTLHIDHTSRWFGNVVAVNDITMDISPGVTGLLGPNGAGKSTLINMMAGFLPPSTGSVTLDAAPIWRNQDAYKQIGLVPEREGMYEFLTGWDFVLANAELHKLSDPPAAARRALATVEMEQAQGRKISTYSKGMRQRVKMAQAIVHDPPLLILDEPLSGMDPVARRRTIRMIKDWARMGKSIIVSSHILHEVESMTSNILLINNGRILAEGNIHQIRDLIDEHPHMVHIRAEDPRALARRFLADDDVLSLQLEPGALVVRTARPDAFYARLTALAASGELGVVEEVTSPDDNLAAVFEYLVK
jgi:ABC-2 type transport system ATP-binding protein